MQLGAAHRVILIGATGFIGRHLAAHLAALGVTVTGVSRRAGAQVPGIAHWQTMDALDLAGQHAIVNLSGEAIDQRWTPARKRRFYDSRVGVSRDILRVLQQTPESKRPAVWLNGSGSGIYGDRGEDFLDDHSDPGSGFLAELCVAWEMATYAAEAFGVRVVCLRTPMVLGEGGAAWTKLRRVFGLGLGGKLGSGNQWVPWIHIDDHVRCMVHAIEDDGLHGPLAPCAPEPIRNIDFTKIMAAALHRPAVFAVPAPILKLAVGGMADALLDSQRLRSSILAAAGFTFRYPHLEQALEALTGAASSASPS